MKIKRHQRCCRKVAYATKADAREALKRFGKARGARRYYRCPLQQFLSSATPYI